MASQLFSKKVSTLHSNSSKISVRYDNMYMYQVPKSGSTNSLFGNTRNPVFKSLDDPGIGTSGLPSTDQDQGEYTGRNHNFVSGGKYTTEKR